MNTLAGFLLSNLSHLFLTNEFMMLNSSLVLFRYSMTVLDCRDNEHRWEWCNLWDVWHVREVDARVCRFESGLHRVLMSFPILPTWWHKIRLRDSDHMRTDVFLCQKHRCYTSVYSVAYSFFFFAKAIKWETQVQFIRWFINWHSF